MCVCVCNGVGFVPVVPLVCVFVCVRESVCVVCVLCACEHASERACVCSSVSFVSLVPLSRFRDSGFGFRLSGLGFRV